MNKSARILFLIIALLGAFIVSYVVYLNMNKQKQSTGLTAKSRQDTVEIAVVARHLNRGAKIVDQDLRMAFFLEKTLPQGHFTDLSKAVGRIVIKPIQVTEPLLESALASSDFTKGGMAAVINPQKRAMAVKVNQVIGVAGFLHPGHYVDVLVSLTKPGEKKSQVAKTVLENILVLSVGTQAEESADKKSNAVTVVTLEVNLEEGEKLALAVNQGRIQLALRGYADTDQILTKGISVPTLLKSYATTSNEPVKVNKMKTAVSKPRRIKKEWVIEVMNGNNISKITMNGN
ncbi:MAG: Flp pilus assembly protein CpaB [Thermodesulfobacteriota bacterium]|nr:Flp pilus assembly protein CpaB [Thermodesulfobacteriota bacterium]